MRRISPIIPAFLLCFVSAVAAHAHELWIEPLEWQVEVGSTLEAHVINGEDFAGNRQPYLPNRIVMFNLFSETRATRIQNRSGNTPALEAPAHGEGLHIAAYQSTPMTLNYDEWEKFVRFVEHKDLGDIGTMHDARGLSRDFYHRIWKKYQDPAAWRWERKSEYGNKGQGTPAIDGENRTMWIFEPHVAEEVFEDYVREFEIPVYRDEWLDRSGGGQRRRPHGVTDAGGYPGHQFGTAS